MRQVFKSARKIMETQIETIFYEGNLCGNMAKMDERKCFVEDNKGQRIWALNGEEQIEVMKHFVNIKNVWFENPNAEQIEVLAGHRKLRYLTLGSKVIQL